ncbi:MAG: NAD(P)-dependent oxidoreductase [Alphaproteobacteria bacterium]|nr:NAD(P)-dependent oxidoreductase [Alphaproteobacteria bacterium]
MQEFPARALTRVLVTGSRGLIGTALLRALRHVGVHAVGLDLRADGDERGDVRVTADVARALDGCDGVIHLAAVSRVIDGEKDPDRCWDTNVHGTQNIVEAACRQDPPPWLIYASSREVYGQPATLLADEDTPRNPVNIYGRSKVAAEDLVDASPLQTAIVRFSNVYGWVADHADRVVPAFARQAAEGRQLRVDGVHHTFDFNHLDDTVRGVMNVVDHLRAGASLPPIHFVTGQPTTLGELADLAIELAASTSSMREARPRSFDVARFYGDPGRAKALLGWQAEVPLRDGLRRLIADFRPFTSPAEVAS